MKHKLLGLCTYCSEKAEPNHTLCFRHNELQKIRKKNMQQKYKKENLCACCGSKLDKDIDENRNSCWWCRHPKKRLPRILKHLSERSEYAAYYLQKIPR
jgi:hypothetical protein